MRVAIVPFAPDNPYQGLLIEALDQLGHRVDVHAGISTALMIESERFDVLHLHWPPRFRPRSIPGLLRELRIILALRRRGVRIVWTIHNAIPHDSKYPRIELRVARVIARLAHQLICHSAVAQAQIARLYKVDVRRVSVVPHGNYLGYYKNEITREDARGLLGLDDRDTVILSFGLIRPYKGVENLIDQFVKSKGDHIRLVIAGKPWSDSMEGDLRTRVGDDKRILLNLGFVSDEEVQVFMNAADICAFTYKKSLTSGALLLAMSFGKACLAYDVGEPLLSDRGCVLVRNGDADDLRENIERVGGMSGDRLAAMGEHNLHVAKDFDWRTIARQTERVYRPE